MCLGSDGARSIAIAEMNGGAILGTTSRRSRLLEACVIEELRKGLNSFALPGARGISDRKERGLGARLAKHREKVAVGAGNLGAVRLGQGEGLPLGGG
jgi:hypothetical protein